VPIRPSQQEPDPVTAPPVSTASSAAMLRRRAARALQRVRDELHARRGDGPYWQGRLSTSALATATALSAMALADDPPRFDDRIRRGLRWLEQDHNPDGGWGDCPRSKSNPATTLLVWAALRLSGLDENAALVRQAAAYCRRHGGVPAVLARYGDDRTFSVPIATNAALAGLADWADVPPLPFALAALPRGLFTLLNLRVVSYALPALIAIGLLGRRCGARRGPLRRALGHLATGPALRRLTRLLPDSGGFLEAVPLTAFVAMALIAAGEPDHAAVREGLRFVEARQRPDGGWPIDSELSVWCTTLTVNALGDGDAATCDWLLDRQYRRRHPFTGAAPGGWAWTHRPGGVPDADDTAGALLALWVLPRCERTVAAARAGLTWLMGLQNRDGGIPTFCRGWNRLPFDRSTPDLTAHFLRAAARWSAEAGRRRGRLGRSVRRAIEYLRRAQRPDGSWLPLWFGNQDAADEANPVYGTGRVLSALGELRMAPEPAGRRAIQWLLGVQAADGGFGGDAGVTPSVEETAVALDGLLATGLPEAAPACRAALGWLCARIEQDDWTAARPIGLYFAKLWYAEQMYPPAFAAAALRRATGAGHLFE
jgi:squalene-hopene/tetraprenyl-beta-curcumene cyclase